MHKSVAAVILFTFYALGAVTMYNVFAKPEIRSKVIYWFDVDMRQQCLIAQNWCDRNGAAWTEPRSVWSVISGGVSNLLGSTATDIKQHITDAHNDTRADVAAKIAVASLARWILPACLVITPFMCFAGPVLMWFMDYMFFTLPGTSFIMSADKLYALYMASGVLCVWVFSVLNDCHPRRRTDTNSFCELMSEMNRSLARGKATFGSISAAVLHKFADVIKVTVPKPVAATAGTTVPLVVAAPAAAAADAVTPVIMMDAEPEPETAPETWQDGVPAQRYDAEYASAMQPLRPSPRRRNSLYS